MTKRVKTAEKPIEHVAAYLRVSTEEQADSGLGMAAQLDQVNAMAVVKQWPQPTIYRDDGVTGMIDIGDRPDGKRLLADITAGKIDAVIISALSRIGRKATYIINFVDDIKDSIQLVSCKEFIDTSTAIGRFLVTMMAGLAELERDTISERTIDALEARYRDVGISSGKPPYGYHYIGEHGKVVVIFEQEAEIVRRVYELHEQGLSYRAIATATHNRIGFVTVKNILDRKDVYMGGQIGESANYWPVILQ